MCRRNNKNISLITVVNRSTVNKQTDWLQQTEEREKNTQWRGGALFEFTVEMGRNNWLVLDRLTAVWKGPSPPHILETPCKIVKPATESSATCRASGEIGQSSLSRYVSVEYFSEYGELENEFVWVQHHFEDGGTLSQKVPCKCNSQCLKANTQRTNNFCSLPNLKALGWLPPHLV